MANKVAFVAISTSLALAAPASADSEQDYLDQLKQSNVPFDDQRAMRDGRVVCDDFRLGLPREDVIDGDFGVFDRKFASDVVDAAQNHLCPETLGANGKSGGSDAPGGVAPNSAGG